MRLIASTVVDVVGAASRAAMVPASCRKASVLSTSSTLSYASIRLIMRSKARSQARRPSQRYTPPRASPSHCASKIVHGLARAFGRTSLGPLGALPAKKCGSCLVLCRSLQPGRRTFCAWIGNTAPYYFPTRPLMSTSGEPSLRLPDLLAHRSNADRRLAILSRCTAPLKAEARAFVEHLCDAFGCRMKPDPLPLSTL